VIWLGEFPFEEKVGSILVRNIDGVLAAKRRGPDHRMRPEGDRPTQQAMLFI
jgi:hypothetical protein